MKVLLIGVNQEKRPIPVIPFGLCYVASALREAGHQVELCDLMFVEDIRGELAKVIGQLNPEVIAISIRNIEAADYIKVWFYGPQIKEVTDYCKELTDAPIVVGGYGFSTKPEQVLRYLELELGIIGEGERAICELVKKINSPDDLAEIPGIARLRDGKYSYLKPRLMENLDNLPLPAVDLIDYGKYKANGGMGSIQSKRGCPYHCFWCQIPQFEGHLVRMRPTAKVVDEVESLVKDYQMDSFYFVDNIFNWPRDHARDICQEIINRGLKVQWMAGFHPQFFDREFVKLMAKAGCVYVMFENCPVTRMGWELDVESLRNASRYCKEEGLKFCHFNYFGAPGEDLQSLKKLFKVMEEVEPDAFYIIYVLPALPGTPLAEVAKREGSIPEIGIEPVFYESPAVDDTIKDYIQQHVDRHENWFLTLDLDCLLG